MSVLLFAGIAFSTMFQQLSSNVTICGLVAQPGSYKMCRNMRVMDALRLARGEKIGASRLVITRQGKTAYSIRIDLRRLITRNDATQNILLAPGDILSVQKRETPAFPPFGGVTPFWPDRNIYTQIHTKDG